MVEAQTSHPASSLFIGESAEMSTFLLRRGFVGFSFVKGLQTPSEASYQHRRRKNARIVIRGNGVWSHREIETDQVHASGVGKESLETYIAGLLPRAAFRLWF